MNLCTIKGCLNYGRYCRLHLTTTMKEQKPISKVADKRKPVLKQYAIESRKFIKANPNCKLKVKGCTKKTQGIHHRKGKATDELLMDKRWWTPACNHCNLMVEIKDAESRQKDLKLSKFNDKVTNK